MTPCIPECCEILIDPSKHKVIIIDSHLLITVSQELVLLSLHYVGRLICTAHVTLQVLTDVENSTHPSQAPSQIQSRKKNEG